MKYEIRKANIADLNEKALVHYKAWIETYTGLMPQEFLDSRTMDDYLNSAIKFIDNTIVAEISDKIVGFACYCNDSKKTNKTSLEIISLYVLKSCQGQGIGTALMNKCFELLGSKKIVLYVLNNNYNSIKFYKNRNFIFTGKEIKKEVPGGYTIELEMIRDTKI